VRQGLRRQEAKARFARRGPGFILEVEMNDDEFLEFSETRFTAGQHELANAMRTLVAREDPDVYEALADAGDAAFLEPLFFTYFFAKPPRMELPQIAFGHVPISGRPNAFPIETDARGIVYLPNVGHLLTSRPKAALMAFWDGVAGLTLKDDDERIVPHALRERSLVPGTEIEVVWQTNPLLDATFMDVDAAYVNRPIPSVGPRHDASIARALALIEEHEPAYYELLLRATRQIFAFTYPRVNSFATLNAHGVAYFNAQERDDEVYFVDELVHQCGHIIFNAMTVQRRELFVADPDVSIAELCPGRRSDTRSLYTVLHGLYTERAMVQCLRKLDERGVFDGRRAHELRGRLAFIFWKMSIDVANVSQPRLFTPLGESLVDVFRATFRATERERPDLRSHVLSGQPYNFNYELYARNNPIEQMSSASAAE
jgi:HEXXH motif-containing protein